ncbi:MAG: hypothetical protein D6806_03470, partial [Deltaproteobacteria bacterium]
MTLKLAVYGKGGVGKSMVATALSVLFAKRKKRVLHVGCDPKSDSTARLLEPGQQLSTVLDVLSRQKGGGGAPLVHVGRLGIHCCEAGGPPPGLGCGGRGVARTLEYLEETEVITGGGYDVIVFDVLGDVVCGGFAAPLREGFAQLVIVVTSEEPMSLYAANNISRAVCVYHENGVHLAGLVGNLRATGPEQEKLLESFAGRLGTGLLGMIPRDPEVIEAERRRLTVVEYNRGAPASKALEKIAKRI